MESLINIDHDILDSFDGNIITSVCRFTGQEKNKYWLVKNRVSGQEYYIMDVSNNRFTKFEIESLEKVLSFNKTWTVSNGYVVCEYERNKKIALHAFLMDHSGHGKGNISVDHINRDKLDNRISNLRLATQSEQNSNTDKRNRKYNAKPLPEGIDHMDLPKYVTYNAEYKNNEIGERVMFRDYFRIEKHPSQNGKIWSTSKSAQYTIKQKLQQAIEHLKILDASNASNASDVIDI